MVFKTTYIDRGNLLRDGAFFLMRMALFPSLDKRNTRDKVKGLRITLEGHIGEWGVRSLSTLNRGQDSRQQSLYILGASALRRGATSSRRSGVCEPI